MMRLTNLASVDVRLILIFAGILFLPAHARNGCEGVVVI